VGRLSALQVADIERARESILWEVMEGDHMLTAANRDHYASVGESALRVIQASLLLANIDPPKKILDFGCGSGRVTRWLRAVYPEADIVVSDVRADSLDFCSQTFNATIWKSGPDFDALEAPAAFDLIWSGSLMTHLSEERSMSLLRNFKKWLTPNGVCVVTAHGRRVISNMIARKNNYIPANRIEEVLAGLANRGFAYVPYGNQDIGFSVNTPEWLLRATRDLDVRLLAIAEHSWDIHQDALSFQKPA